MLPLFQIRSTHSHSRFHLIYGLCFILLILLSVCPLLAQANEKFYNSPDKYSITTPPGWEIASKDQMGFLEENFNAVIKTKLESLDFDHISVAIFDPGNDDFMENMNIVITEGEIPVSKSSIKEYKQYMIPEFEKLGMQIISVTGEIEKIGDHKCLSMGIVYKQSLIEGIPDVESKLLQVVIPGKKRSFIISCTAANSNFSTYLPLFRKSIASFVDLNKKTGWDALPGALRGGIIGGLIALVISFFSLIFGSKKSQVETQNTALNSTENTSEIENEENNEDNNEEKDDSQHSESENENTETAEKLETSDVQEKPKAPVPNTANNSAGCTANSWIWAVAAVVIYNILKHSHH